MKKQSATRYLSVGLVTMALGAASLGANCPGASTPACPDGATCVAATNVYSSGFLDLEGCDSGSGGLGGTNLDAPVGVGFVGWDHNTRGNRLHDRGNCDKAVYYYRTAFLFNTQVIADFVKQHGLLKAVMRFVTPTSLEGPGVPYQAKFPNTCVAHLGQANDTNWIGEDTTDYNPTPFTNLLDIPFLKRAPFDNGIVKVSPDPTSGGVVTEIDITTTTREWLLGRHANNGLVLSGDNESLSPDDGACDSTVQTFQIELWPFHASAAH